MSKPSRKRKAPSSTKGKEKAKPQRTFDAPGDRAIRDGKHPGPTSRELKVTHSTDDYEFELASVSSGEVKFYVRARRSTRQTIMSAPAIGDVLDLIRARQKGDARGAPLIATYVRVVSWLVPDGYKSGECTVTSADDGPLAAPEASAST